jgi:hypothetical protein
MNIQEAAKTAIEVQDACNLSGVLASFQRIVSDVLWPEAHKQKAGTEFVNQHAISTLFLSKLCSLNGGHYACDYLAASDECERIAASEA